MKYLCLIYDEEKNLATMSKGEADAMMGEYFAFTDGIKKSGHYLGGEALQPVQTATTVRVRNGKLSTTDGPFAETREQLGGFYLINARDLNDAHSGGLEDSVRSPRKRRGAADHGVQSGVDDGTRDPRGTRLTGAIWMLFIGPSRAASSLR